MSRDARTPQHEYRLRVQRGRDAYEAFKEQIRRAFHDGSAMTLVGMASSDATEEEVAFDVEIYRMKFRRRGADRTIEFSGFLQPEGLHYRAAYNPYWPMNQLIVTVDEDTSGVSAPGGT